MLLPEIACDPDTHADTRGLFQPLGQALMVEFGLRYAALVCEATADNAEAEITHAASS
jgi:hypothetical protein